MDATLHIGAIHSYIHERNPVAATRVISRVRTAAEQLGEHPRIGHAGTAAGTFERVVTGLPYVIVYEARDIDDEIVVIGIYHGAQLRPGLQQPD
ncbi:MAG: type II toxin-antitoxin system RelE/ParE family toxin [Xanthobacteraceae bacterium]|nr:type II toxin-antitoxin system RelE/ParE family toxin [Xanthobacteraceae bacterium]